jgi:hypothetical protein
MRGIGRAAANESRHPSVVKLDVVSDGLDVKVSRQIVQFHKLRRIQPQYGRTIFRRNGPDYHWCFDDLSVAHAFIEQFGGELYKAGIRDSSRLAGRLVTTAKLPRPSTVHRRIAGRSVADR